MILRNAPFIWCLVYVIECLSFRSNFRQRGFVVVETGVAARENAFYDLVLIQLQRNVKMNFNILLFDSTYEAIC